MHISFEMTEKQGVPKMTQLVFVRTSSNLHQIWKFLANR